MSDIDILGGLHMFWRRKNNERLFKFVYDRASGYSWEKQDCTLLVTARDHTEAVKKFYELANNNVANIKEFTEIKYSSEEGVVSEQS
jgi:hypothetical protein